MAGKSKPSATWESEALGALVVATVFLSVTPNAGYGQNVERQHHPDLPSAACWSASPTASAAAELLEPTTRIGRPLFPHDLGIDHLLWHPGGKALLTAKGGRLRLWKLEDGTLAREFAGPLYTAKLPFGGTQLSCALGVAFSPDGAHFLAADVEGMLVWESREQPVAFVPHPVKAQRSREGRLSYEIGHFPYAVSAGGHLVAALEFPTVENARANEVSVFDTRTRRKLLTTRLGAEITALAFSTDGKHLYAGGRDAERRSRLWIIRATGAGVSMSHVLGLDSKAFPVGLRDSPLRILPASDGAWATVYSDGEYVRLNLDTGAASGYVDRARSNFTRPWALSWDGGRLAEAAFASRPWGVPGITISIVDLATGRRVGPQEPFETGVEYAIASPDGRHWVVWSSDPKRDAIVFDARSKQPIGPLPQSGGRQVVAGFSADARRLAVASELAESYNKSRLAVFALDPAPVMTASTELPGNTTGIAVAADGRWIALNSAKPPYQGMLDTGGEIQLRDGATLALQRSFARRDGAKRHQLYGPFEGAARNELLYYGEWDTAPGAESRGRREHEFVAISTGSWEPTVLRRFSSNILWRVAPWLAPGGVVVRPELIGGRSRLAITDAASGDVKALVAGDLTGPHAFSASGHLLAAVIAPPKANAIGVFDLSKGTRIAALSAGECPTLRHLAFSADGSELAAACSHGVLLFWRFTK